MSQMIYEDLLLLVVGVSQFCDLCELFSLQLPSHLSPGLMELCPRHTWINIQQRLWSTFSMLLSFLWNSALQFWVTSASQISDLFSQLCETAVFSLGFPCLQWDPECDSRQKAKGLPHLFPISWESQYHTVCCSMVWKQLFCIIFSSFLIVHDGRICLDPITPSWPDIEVQLLHFCLYIREKGKPQDWKQGYSCYKSKMKQHLQRVMSKMWKPS